MRAITQLFKFCALLSMCLAANAALATALSRWDALPALDVLHVQGPDQGTRVCPMCRYGYDAGVLLFVPADASADLVRRWVAQLDADATLAQHPRFRRFLLFTGSKPGAQLLQLTQSKASNWFVVQLDASALTEVQAMLGMNVKGQAVGVVFAQRRMLWRFTSSEFANHAFASGRSWQRHTQEALSVLAWQYPAPVSSNDPDVPRGGLWLAPERLSSVIDLAGRKAFARMCWTKRRHLIGVEHESRRGVQWGISDREGCIQIRVAAERTTPIELKLHWLSDVGKVQYKKLQVQRNQELLLPDALEAQDVTLTKFLQQTPVLAPCEGCAEILDTLPLIWSSTSRIAAHDEPGEKLVIEGQVRSKDGTARAGVLLFANQTNAGGVYPSGGPSGGPSSGPSGGLSAWARTDLEGRYRFDTVRPGSYPGQSIPQHVHFYVVEPGCALYFIDDVEFLDDPKLLAAHKARTKSRGGNGRVMPKRYGSGWHVRRDITLGQGVANHSNCAPMPIGE